VAIAPGPLPAMSTRVAGRPVVKAKLPDDPAPLETHLDELRDLMEQARELRKQAMAWRKDFQKAVEAFRQDLQAQRLAQKERKRR
jgi:hypothetical protein